MNIAEGLKREGRQERDIEIARNLLAQGLDIAVIKEATELSDEKINEIRESLHQIYNQ